MEWERKAKEERRQAAVTTFEEHLEMASRQPDHLSRPQSARYPPPPATPTPRSPALHYAKIYESRWGRHGQDYKNADAASFPQHIKSKTTITSVGEFRYWHARATPTVCDFDEGVRKAEEEKKAAEEKAAREAAMLVDTPEMDEFGNVLGALGDVFGALETSPLFARLTAEGGTRAKRRGSFVTSSLDDWRGKGDLNESFTITPPKMRVG